MNVLTLEGHQGLFWPLSILFLFGFIVTFFIRKRSGEVRNQWCRVVVLGAFLLLLGPLFPVHYDVLPTAKTITLTQADLASLASLPEPAKPFPWMNFYWVGAGMVLGVVLLGFGRAALLRRRAQRLPGQLDVRVSTQIRVPMAVGLFDASILVPQSATQDPDFGTVLLHEAAHVRRRDTLWLLPMSVLQVIFWYHPLVWIWAIQLRATAEHAADDWVIRQGVQPASYAKQLLEYAKTLSAEPGLWASSPFARTGRLAYRLRRILNPLTEKTMITRKHSLALLSGAVVLTAGLCAISFARPDGTSHSKKAKKHQVTNKLRKAPVVSVSDEARPAMIADEAIAPAAPPAGRPGEAIAPAAPAAPPMPAQIQDVAAPAAPPAGLPGEAVASAAAAVAPIVSDVINEVPALINDTVGPAVETALASIPAAMQHAMKVDGHQIVVVDGVVYDIKKGKDGKLYLSKAPKERQAEVIRSVGKPGQFKITRSKPYSQFKSIDGMKLHEVPLNLKLNGERSVELRIPPMKTGKDGLRYVEGQKLTPEQQAEVKKAMAEARKAMAEAFGPEQRAEMERGLAEARKAMAEAKASFGPEQRAQMERDLSRARKEMAEARAAFGPEQQREVQRAMEQARKAMADARVAQAKGFKFTGNDQAKLQAELKAVREQLADAQRELARLKAKKPAKPAKEEGSIEEPDPSLKKIVSGY